MFRVDFTLKMMQPMPEEDEDRGSYKLVHEEEDAVDDNEELHGAKDEEDLNRVNERELVKKLDKRIMPCLFAMIVLK
jgi:hypothetical protein